MREGNEISVYHLFSLSQVLLKSSVTIRMVGKSELIWVWTRKSGESIGECQVGGWGHALVKSFSEKEDKLPIWAPKNETQIIKSDSLGKVSCDNQKSLNFAGGAGK